MLSQIQNKAKCYSKGVILEENWMPVPMVPLPGRQSQNSIFYWHLNVGKTYIAQQVLTLCYEVCKNGALQVIYELPHIISQSLCNLQSTQKRRAAHHFLLKEKPKQFNHLQ